MKFDNITTEATTEFRAEKVDIMPEASFAQLDTEQKVANFEAMVASMQADALEYAHRAVALNRLYKMMSEDLMKHPELLECEGKNEDEAIEAFLSSKFNNLDIRYYDVMWIAKTIIKEQEDWQ